MDGPKWSSKAKWAVYRVIMLKLRINRRLYVHTFKCNRPMSKTLFCTIYKDQALRFDCGAGCAVDRARITPQKNRRWLIRASLHSLFAPPETHTTFAPYKSPWDGNFQGPSTTFRMLTLSTFFISAAIAVIATCLSTVQIRS